VSREAVLPAVRDTESALASMARSYTELRLGGSYAL